MFRFKLLLGVVAGLCLNSLSPAQVNVLTYHNDDARTGANLNETLLTPSNVAPSTFGKLFTYNVDGYVYAQPLYVSGLAVPGQGTHNAVFVATEHNSVYCFDADSNAGTNGGVLWQVNLGPSAPCPVPGFEFRAITNEVGITGTPVIDPVSQTLYVDAFTTDGVNYFHSIHALNIADGSERPFSPVIVNVSIPGNGAGSSGGVLPFQAIQQLQRGALTLAGGVLYVSYAGYTDITGATDPFHGWIIGFDASTLQVLSDRIFNSTPNGTSGQFGAAAGEGGIWMGGGGLAVDSDTNLYFSTGDGNFNAYSGGTEYGNSVIKLSTANGLSVADYFTSYNQDFYRLNDLDIGSGGVMLLPDQSGPYAHLMVAGGKPQYAYLLNRDQMTTDNQHYNAGGSSDNIVQTMSLGGASFSTPAYYNGLVYYIGNRDAIRAYIVSDGTLIPDQPGTFGSRIFSFPGATPSISANGATNGIAWAIQNAKPAVLVAWNATNLSTEIYNSAQSGTRDQLPGPVKFTVPTIANGKVYVGAQFSLSVFGLLGGGVQFSSTNYTTLQTNGSATITVNRVGGSTGAVQVGYATAPGGTAIAGQDYVATSGTLNWAGGDASPKSFSVALLNNPQASTNQTIFLTLSNATGGAYLGSLSNSVLTITNSVINTNGGSLQFSASNYTALQTNGTVAIAVNRTGASAGAVQVDYATAPGGSAVDGQDYVATNGTLSWIDGDTSPKTFNVTILENQQASTNKTIFLALSNAIGGAYLGSLSNSVLTITNSVINTNGGSLQFSASNYTALQTNGTVAIAVNRTGASVGAVQVDYATAPGGSAVDGQDYVATNGTLSWIDGDTSPKTFNVTILDNPQANTNKTIFLTLSNAIGGAYLGSISNSVLTITNNVINTNGGSLQFSASNYTALQTNGTAAITVNRTGASVGAVQVDYATAPGGSAVDGQDYVATNGTLSWIDGDTSPKTFNVTILDNPQANTNKTIFLTLSNAIGGAYLGSLSNSVLTITNPAPSSAYAVWKSFHFGANANDTAIAGDAADPDADGLPNALEYALGSDPNVADTNRPVLGAIVSNHFQIQFNRNSSATDMTYFVEATIGLTNGWSNLVTYLAGSGWITNTPGSTIVESPESNSPPDAHVQVTITDPVDTTDPASTNRFFLLKVQH